MTKRVQIVGMTSSALATFDGFERELVVNLTAYELTIHKGLGAGNYARILDKTANDSLYQPLTSLLTALAALSATGGLISKTGAATVAARTLTGTTNQVTITNGDGASGNPTVALSSALTFPGTITTSAGQLATFNTAQVGGLTVISAADLGTVDVTGGKFKTPTGAVNAVGNLSASQTISIASGRVITCAFASLGAGATIIFSGYPASGTYACWEVHIAMDATPHSITFQKSSGNAVTYDSVSGAPSAVASKIMKFFFETTDGGTTVTAHYMGSF